MPNVENTLSEKSECPVSLNAHLSDAQIHVKARSAGTETLNSFTICFFHKINTFIEIKL